MSIGLAATEGIVGPDVRVSDFSTNGVIRNMMVHPLVAKNLAIVMGAGIAMERAQ